MPGKQTLFLIAALVLSVAVSGCLAPSDQEIQSELNAVRRHAYEEWKAARERGDTREARADGPLTLDDAVKLALQYNKPLQYALQNRDIAQGQKWADYAVVFPSAVVQASGTRIEKGRGNWDTDAYSFGLTVTQPIAQGARIPATLRWTKLNVALTDEQIRETVQELIQQVANNYYDVLLAQHLVDTYREALVSAEAQLRMTTEKKRQETATDYDVLRAQVDVATYQASMISQQNAIDTNRVAMLKNMGISQDSQITLADDLEFIPMRPVFERAVEIASCLRPDLRQAELNADMEAQAVRIAQSAWWPSIEATFTQRWTDGWHSARRNDDFGRNPWQAGIGASLYLGVDNYGRVEIARAQARQAQINLLDKQELTLMEIRQYMNSLVNAEEQVKALQVNQNAAREALRLVLVGYQAGVRTEVDVTDARKALTEVMGQYYTALADHTKARLNLQVAMGVLGPCRVTDYGVAAPTVPIASIEEFVATDYTPPAPITMPVIEDIPPGPDATRAREVRERLEKEKVSKATVSQETVSKAETAQPARGRISSLRKQRVAEKVAMR